MAKNLTFLAGKKALSIIKGEGLRPDRIKIIVGAAGGPKWLVLNHLDRVLFSQWLKPRNHPLFLVGSSIGSWRFTAASTSDPISTIEKFQSAYIQQSFKTKPTPKQVSHASAAVLDTYLGAKEVFDVLHHPYIRLNILAVRSKWPVASDRKGLLSAGLTSSLIVNFLSRKLLRFFFERTLFFDSRHVPPFTDMNSFHFQKIPLTEHVLKPALLASGSIPLVMSGVTDIPGAVPGIYRDGGLLDYHPDISFSADDDIILFPHYMHRIIPGWMDKGLCWRKPSRINMENVVLVAPSKLFIENLPYKKIPDRNDFYMFRGKQEERISYWNTVVEQSKKLGDEFLDTVQTDKIRELIKPMKQVKLQG